MRVRVEDCERCFKGWNGALDPITGFIEWSKDTDWEVLQNEVRTRDEDLLDAMVETLHYVYRDSEKFPKAEKFEAARDFLDLNESEILEALEVLINED